MLQVGTDERALCSNCNIFEVVLLDSHNASEIIVMYIIHSRIGTLQKVR